MSAAAGLQGRWGARREGGSWAGQKLQRRRSRATHHVQIRRGPKRRGCRDGPNTGKLEAAQEQAGSMVQNEIKA